MKADFHRQLKTLTNELVELKYDPAHERSDREEQIVRLTQVVALLRTNGVIAWSPSVLQIGRTLKKELRVLVQRPSDRTDAEQVDNVSEGHIEKQQMVFRWYSDGIQMVFRWYSDGIQMVFSPSSVLLQSFFSVP